MQRFLEAKSGVYCGPLKLLATEIYHKSNKQVSFFYQYTQPCQAFRRLKNSDSRVVYETQDSGIKRKYNDTFQSKISQSISTFGQDKKKEKYNYKKNKLG